MSEDVLHDVEDPNLADLLKEWEGAQYIEVTSVTSEEVPKREKPPLKKRPISDAFDLTNKNETSRNFESHIAPHVKPTIAESIVHQAKKGHFDEVDEIGVAFTLLDNSCASILYDHDMKKSYRALFKFLMYLALILIIVCWQSQFFSSGALAFKSMKDQLFGTHRGVVITDYVINERVSDLNDFLDFVNDTLVANVFDEPICGDQICQQPEEYPKFVAAEDARQFQGSCESDCGEIPKRTVSIDFFDVSKLKAAYDTVNKALESEFQGIPARSWKVVDTNGNVLRTPAAGWNICSKTDKEFGFFTTVCIFDADIKNGEPFIINGLPYRTAELDDSSTQFGGTKTVELYQGEWELRIAFTNFSWPHFETGILQPVAFPAVRGQICIHHLDDEPTCEIWSPCPNECNCEWYKNKYLCYEEHSVYPGWSSWQDGYQDYPKTLSIDFAGQDMIQNYEPFSTFNLFNVTFGTRSDPQWEIMNPETCLRPFILRLGDSWGDFWNEGFYQITRISDAVIVATGTQDSEYLNISYGLDYFWNEDEFLLCPDDESYLFEIYGGDWPSEMAWVLIDTDDGSIPLSGLGAHVFTSAAASDTYSCYLFSSNDVPSCTDLLGLDTDEPSIQADLHQDNSNRRLSHTSSRKLLQNNDDIDDNVDLENCDGNLDWLGDAYCDYELNNENCLWDRGDCCSSSCANSDDYTCGDNGFFCLDPSYTSCPSNVSLIGDGKCDAETNTLLCFWDGDDCCDSKCISSNEYTCGSAGYNCLDPDALLPTPAPTSKPTVYPTISQAPTKSPTINLFENNWLLPWGALLSCSTFEEVDSSDLKCSKLEYHWSENFCSQATMGDGQCDKSNNHLGCGYDLGDCCECTTNDCEEECYAVQAEPNGEDPETSWPYYLELGNDYVTTYPHTYASSVLDIVTAQQNFRNENFVQEINTSSAYIPSFACGDCSVYGEDDYLSISFDVAVSENIKYEMFPTLGNDTIRERYFSYPNRILGGIVISQLRQRAKDCRSPPFDDKNDNEVCLNYAGDETYYDYTSRAYTEESPFGNDPTFVDTSTVYRATNKEMINDLYQGWEINENGVPYGFFADSSAGAWQEIVRSGCSDLEGLWLLNSLDPLQAGKCMRYPILYDINFNRSRAFEVSEILKEGNYLDSQTGFVAAQFATYNVITRTFYFFHVSIQRMPSGEFRFFWSIKDVVAELYSTTSDHVRFSIEIVFLIAFCYLLSIEVKEFLILKKRTGSSLTYFFDLGNIVDLANYIIVLVCMVLHFLFFFSSREMRKKARYHYDVYDDYYSAGRTLKMKHHEAVDMTRFFRALNKLAELRSLFENMLAIYLILVAIQLIKNLSFHPLLGVVSHTLYHARNDLTFFLFLLISVNVVYAFLGTVLFGSTVESFATFIISLSTSMQILSGVYSPLEDTGTTPIALVYFFFTTLLNYFLLFNFLLAIVVDAYQKAKAETEANPLYNFNHDPFFEMARSTMGFPIAGRCHLPDRELLHAFLDASVGLRRKLTKYNVDTESRHDSNFSQLNQHSTNTHMRHIAMKLKRRSRVNSQIEGDGNESHFYSVERFESSIWRKPLENAHEADSLRIFIFPRLHRGKKSCVAVNQHLLELALRKGFFPSNFKSNLTTTEENAIKILAYNFIERFGHKVDKNNDGVLGDDELDSIRNLLHVELKSNEAEKLVHAFVGHRSARWIDSSSGDLTHNDEEKENNFDHDE